MRQIKPSPAAFPPFPPLNSRILSRVYILQIRPSTIYATHPIRRYLSNKIPTMRSRRSRPTRTMSTGSKIDYPPYSAVCCHHPLGIFHSQHPPFSPLTPSSLFRSCTIHSRYEHNILYIHSRYEHNILYIVICSLGLAKISSISNSTHEVQLRFRQNNTFKCLIISTIHVGTDGRPFFTMDDQAQFLAPPPISSPPQIQQNPSSKLQYTSYSLRSPYTPQSRLDFPSFFSNSSSSPTSST